MKNSRLRMILLINLFVIILQLLIATANHAWDTSALIRSLAISLIYSNVTAISAVLILPRIFEKISRLRHSLFPLISLLCIFILLGCLVCQTLLWATGILSINNFWLFYFRTLPGVIAGAMVFGFGAFLYGSIQKKLQEKEIAEAREKKLVAEARLHSLESRINPHFLFNALNSISSLIAENPAAAEKTVGRLSTLLRSTLDHSNRRLIPLKQELATVKDYLEIEKIRFGQRLRSSIDVPEEFMERLVPPLSILSLVENAVKHGIAPRREIGECAIAAWGNRNLTIEVRDSGPGFSLSEIPAGHGLDNLVERLQTLYSVNAGIKVFKSQGMCTVQMEIPDESTGIHRR